MHCLTLKFSPPRPLYLLGYIPSHNRVYLADKDHRIYGYALSLSVVEYQTAILRGDTEVAAEILPTLPKDQLNKVARFLEARGTCLLSSSPTSHPYFQLTLQPLSTDLKELALQLTTDPDHKFDLALSLDDLDTALQITNTVLENESEVKWKTLGDRALTVWRFDLAKECFEKAGDLSALMLLLMAMGDRDGLKVLAAKAGVSPLFFFFNVLIELFVEEKGQYNLAFAIQLQLGDSTACVDLLTKTQRAPEAALFARTYAPRYIYISTSTSTFPLPIPLISSYPL